MAISGGCRTTVVAMRLPRRSQRPGSVWSLTAAALICTTAQNPMTSSALATVALIRAARRLPTTSPSGSARSVELASASGGDHVGFVAKRATPQTFRSTVAAAMSGRKSARLAKFDQSALRRSSCRRPIGRRAIADPARNTYGPIPAAPQPSPPNLDARIHV